MAQLTFTKNFPFVKSPAICLWKGNTEYPICYLRKPKWVSQELFDRFLEAISISVKKGFLDEIEKEEKIK